MLREDIMLNNSLNMSFLGFITLGRAAILLNGNPHIELYMAVALYSLIDEAGLIMC